MHAELTEATLREPLRAALAGRPVHTIPLGTARAAAVLVPLFERDGQTYVWLVRRPGTMRSHAGQVAFPGGKTDLADGSPLATALREADEELGIRPSAVDVLGALDEIPTVTSFVVSPFVGWLAPTVEIVPNPAEVARAFAVPLREFFAPPAHAPPWQGWTVDGEHVWGATAAILGGFVAILRQIGGSAGPWSGAPEKAVR